MKFISAREFWQLFSLQENRHVRKSALLQDIMRQLENTHAGARYFSILTVQAGEGNCRQLFDRKTTI